MPNGARSAADIRLENRSLDPASPTSTSAHYPTNLTRASFTSSACVQPTLCGPPSISMKWMSFTRSGRRRPVASMGRMRSSVPWITSMGTSILGRSARKSVNQVSTQARVA